jgi:hypothetical protein
MVDTLWSRERDWPISPIGFVFLLQATDQVGRAMFGGEWRRPSFDPDGKSSARQFRRAIKTVAEACEAGELPAVYQRGDGEMIAIEPDYWHLKDWEYCFVDGDASIFVPMFESGFGYAEGAAPGSWQSYPAFVRKRELASFIVKIEAPPPPLPSTPAAVPPANQGSGRRTDRDRIIAEAKNRMKTKTYRSIQALAREIHDWLEKLPDAIRGVKSQKVMLVDTIHDHIAHLFPKK